MKAGFRQSMSWLHTWAGLVLGWLLFFMFLTGTAGYFNAEIDHWMQPEWSAWHAVSTEDAATLALNRLQQQAPDAARWSFNLPVNRTWSWLNLSWQSKEGSAPSASGSERLDPFTGQPLQARATGGGQALYVMHWRLHYMPLSVAEWLVSIAAMFMLIAIVTGVIVHRKIFADFFTFRPSKGQRSWLDAHNVLAVIALPFHLMITYSGLVFLMFTTVPLVVAAYYGPGKAGQQAMTNEVYQRPPPSEASGYPATLTKFTPLLAQAEDRWGAGQAYYVNIHHPGDAQARIHLYQWQGTPLRNGEELIFDGTSGRLLEIVPVTLSSSATARDLLFELHEGLFAGPLLRWLYFLSGLLGTVMIATGLVLWTVKRRQKLEKAGIGTHRGVMLVERLNVGTIIGLPVAIAVYFWANRLIPVDFADRAAWEMHSLFIAWMLLLLHAALRPVARAWVEQCWLAALAFALLPILNMLTTDRHLGVSLPQGDWVMASFDLTMLIFGLAFACIAAILVHRKDAKSARPG
ncbi:PepSY domain-containing protein [Betaproteobacteria bacterium PRO5]|nr:PepSY domain-containing protein [Betaproteobacteria bacterium PRO5]